METFCEAVFAILDHLGVSSGYIWGYSLGGRVAMSMMLQRPGFFRAAVIESANPGIRDSSGRKERADMDDRLAARLQTEGLSRFLEYWYQLPIFGSLSKGPAMSMLLQQRLRNDPDQLAEILRRLSPGRTPCLWKALTDAALPPTLFVAGEEDAKYCDIGARLAGENERIRFERMAGCGHSIHIQQPAALARIALEFLEKVEESHD
jgi:2-succinyl-6-hydroxy-2,4-cyclohexadiene-1-carboxylate synthase